MYPCLVPMLLTACGAGEQGADGYASGPPPSADAIQRQLNSASAAAAPMDRVAGETIVGRTLTPEGEIPPTERTDQFVAGEEIHLAVKVPKPMPPKQLRVAWYGPDDTLVHEDAKRTSGQEEYLSFSTVAGGEWHPGEYRTEVWLDDEKIAEQRFALAQR